MVFKKKQISYGTVFDYKTLLFFHLNTISRASANIAAPSEEALKLSHNPEKVYYQSVRCLDAFVAPYWDEQYKKERSSIAPSTDFFSYANQLLIYAMLLIARKGWLLQEEIEVGKKEE